ncbi:hypothetical protein H6G91_31050 [Nostoc muscorum FACHB-395]|jgi:hypothetical protein|nr:hypothetical protein [Desmonostoc muscorum FACHB-395]
MARKSPQPKATSSEVLECVQQNCPSCGKPMWNEYNNLRRVRTLKGVVQMLLKIRRRLKSGFDTDGVMSNK